MRSQKLVIGRINLGRYKHAARLHYLEIENVLKCCFVTEVC